MSDLNGVSPIQKGVATQAYYSVDQPEPKKSDEDLGIEPIDQPVTTTATEQATENMPKPAVLEQDDVQSVSPEEASLQFTDLEKKVIEEIAYNFQDMIQSSASSDHEVKMQYNEDIDSYVIQVSDQSSGEVVFQIPPEDMLMIGHKMKELVGLLFDEKT